MYDKIRNILEVTLAGISGLPTIFWENVPEDDKNSLTAYIQPKFVPTSTRPAVKGENPQKRYQGLSRIHVHYKEDQGPQALETMVNTIIDAFDATKALTYDGHSLRIEYSERGQILQDSPFAYITINVAWYYYD